MKKKVIFYHPGCPVCKTSEDAVLELIGKSKYEYFIVKRIYFKNVEKL
jgi:hydrogenase maturation factor